MVAELEPQTDLEIVLEYLSHEFLPARVKAAYDRLRQIPDETEALRSELDRLKARMKPDACYF